METVSDGRMINFAVQLFSTDRGLVLAGNMVDSCSGDQPLVKPAFLREFVQECAEALSAGAAGPDLDLLVEKVALGEGPTGRGRLRNAQIPTTQATTDVGTVLKCESFHRFLLSNDYKEDDDIPEALPLVPGPSKSDADEYREALSRITKQANWCKAGATLGRPYPQAANCWVSTDDFGADSNAPAYEGATAQATRRRDELGLSHYGSGAHLLRVRIPSGSIAGASGVQITRPVFSDGGNKHFVVAQKSPRARLFAQAGWGSTVHLGKLRAGTIGCVAGAPERVTSPLTVSELGPVAIDYLGEVSVPPPGDDHDTGKTLRPVVLGDRTPKDLLDKLLRLLREEAL